MFCSRGLWTWPPWVICAKAFNHKIGNVAHSGVSEVLFFTKSYKWKRQRWKKWTIGRQILQTMCFRRSPTVRLFQDGWPTDPITTEVITSPCGLTMFRLFSVISLQHFLRWKFRNMFTEESIWLFFINFLKCDSKRKDIQFRRVVAVNILNLGLHFEIMFFCELLRKC